MTDEDSELPSMPPNRTFDINVKMSAPARGKPLPYPDEHSRASVPPKPPTLSEERYPLITDAECRAFERHAEEGATADPLGEGVEYSLIQPYDLVRFCRTVTELRARIEESDGNA